jgi:hypothetical protein
MKHSTFLRRDPGLDHEEFREQWRTEYAPQVSAHADVVRHTRVLPNAPETADFDGISEVYAEDPAILRAIFGGERATDGNTAAPSREPITPVEDVLPVVSVRTFEGNERVQKNET